MITVNNSKKNFLRRLLALFIVFVVMQVLWEIQVSRIGGSIQTKTPAQQYHQDVFYDDDDDDGEVALMMTDFAQEEGFVMSDDDAASSSSCTMEPCGVSIVFLGDSLSRFQYVSLVYFLRHGVWIDPSALPVLVRPKDYIGGMELAFEWSPWFRASMDALQPYENCDCYREAGMLNGQGGKLPYICENRYYHDPVRNNTVTYLQAYGTATSIRGHWPAQQAIPQLAEYHRTNNQSAIGDTVGPMVGRVPYRWQGTWMDTFRGHVADLAPAVLIMNAGKWRHSFHETTFRDAIVAALQDVGSIIPRVIWKKTTADRGGKYTYNETDETMCALLECVDTTWTVDVPSSMYVDQGHFLEPVYRLLNEQLLHQLGIAIPDSVSSVANHSSVAWYPERLSIPGLVRRDDSMTTLTQH
jgi:hypothetical protein